jgi:hypothetical protein
MLVYQRVNPMNSIYILYIYIHQNPINRWYGYHSQVNVKTHGFLQLEKGPQNRWNHGTHLGT